MNDSQLLSTTCRFGALHLVPNLREQDVRSICDDKAVAKLLSTGLEDFNNYREHIEDCELRKWESMWNVDEFGEEPEDLAQFRRESYKEQVKLIEKMKTRPTPIFLSNEWGSIFVWILRSVFNLDDAVCRPILSQISQRHHRGSFGISWFAEPHLKTAFVNAIMMCFVRLENGLAFDLDSLGGDGVHTIILSLGPVDRPEDWLRIKEHYSRVFMALSENFDGQHFAEAVCEVFKASIPFSTQSIVKMV